MGTTSSVAQVMESHGELHFLRGWIFLLLDHLKIYPYNNKYNLHKFRSDLVISKKTLGGSFLSIMRIIN